MRPIGDNFGFDVCEEGEVIEGDLESPWWWPRPAGDSLVRPWKLGMFIADALEAAKFGEPVGLFAWPPNGRWFWEAGQAYRVSNAIIRGRGVPNAFEGAAFFDNREIDQLASVVFARCMMIDEKIGVGTDDTWVYPAHGRHYLYFSHDEVTRVFAADRKHLCEFDEAFEQRGWAWLRDQDLNP